MNRLSSIHERFFELSNDAMCVVGFDGRFGTLNRACEATFGLPRAALEGLSVFERIHPEDVDATREALARLVAGGAPDSSVTRLRDGSGAYRALSWTAVASAADSAVLCVVRDVTEQEREHAEVRFTSSLLHAIVDSVPQMIWVARSSDRRLVRVNRAFEEFTGRSRRELLGRTLGDALPPEEAEGLAARDSLALDGGHIEEIPRHELATPDRGVRILRMRKTPLFGDGPESSYVLGIAEDTTEARIAQEHSLLILEALHRAANAVVITDIEGRITWVNKAFSTMTGYSSEEAVGQHTRLLKSGHHGDEFYRTLWRTVLAGDVWHGELVNRSKDGARYVEDATITPIRSGDGSVSHFIAIKQDISRRRELEQQLAQAQKLESVGLLAAGIAHEINTPTQYVGDNTRFLADAFRDLLVPLRRVAEMTAAAEKDGLPPEAIAELHDLVREADLDYLAEEIPRAIEQSLEGVQRVSTIVGAMREFSHPGREKVATDVNHIIQTTATVARNEWKYVADLKLDLDPTIPELPCVPGDVSQVLLNLIVNAAHAIADVVQESGRKGVIEISTSRAGDSVEIRVRDTGAGIPPEIREHVFDAFFTTKQVGKGTGQGLTLAHDIVARKHGGSIHFDSKVGRGSCFVIRLPATREATDEAAPESEEVSS